MRAVAFVGLLILPGLLAAEEKPAALKIHFIGYGEYEPEKSLTALKKELEEKYQVECTASLGGDGKKLENLDALKSADVLVLFARRMNLKEDQMAIIRNHWTQGKPIVGIRTASHAFQKADNEVFDKKVLGGNYGGDSSNGGFKPIPSEKAADHPILKGVGEFKAHKYSYGQGQMAEGVTVLQVVDRKKDFPVTWVNTYNGGRVFYTSMGAPEDFTQENFRHLLANAIFWTAKRDPEKMKK
jgi:type 1 glutamine amidotransferase